MTASPRDIGDKVLYCCVRMLERSNFKAVYLRSWELPGVWPNDTPTQLFRGSSTKVWSE